MKNKLENFVKVIGEPRRMQILNLLKKERCVCEIWQELKMPQNLVSHHLKILKDINLISCKRKGVKVIYRRSKSTLKKYLQLLNNYLQ